MKTSRILAVMVMGIALCVTPVYAQRGHGGGGGSRGGGSSFSGGSRGGSSHSSGMSRGSSYSGSSSSRGYSSSSSSSSRSYSSPSSSSRSYSSSSSSSHRSYSPSTSSSRSYSSSSSSSSRSYSSPSGSGSSRSYSSPSAPSRGSYGGGSHRPSSEMRGSSRPTVTRGSATTGVARGKYSGTRPHSSGVGGPTRGNVAPTPATPGSRGRSDVANRPAGTMGGPTTGARTAPYSRPGRPGGVTPPSSRPMHPAPYFHHPHHHGMIHMRPVIWHPLPPRPLFWPGFWYYCNSYWYDYHVTDVVVVRQYVNDTYHVDMIDYAMSGDYMYALVNDSDGKTYLQVYSNEDKLIAEQVVNKKYCKLEIDRENGGCWIFKKGDKDPLLFIYTGSELLIYEAD